MKALELKRYLINYNSLDNLESNSQQAPSTHAVLDNFFDHRAWLTLENESMNRVAFKRVS